jgi:hypothetical protein
MICADTSRSYIYRNSEKGLDAIAQGRVNMAALQSYYTRWELAPGEQFVNQLRNNNNSGVGR